MKYKPMPRYTDGIVVGAGGHGRDDPVGRMFMQPRGRDGRPPASSSTTSSDRGSPSSGSTSTRPSTSRTTPGLVGGTRRPLRAGSTGRRSGPGPGAPVAPPAVAPVSTRSPSRTSTARSGTGCWPGRPPRSSCCGPTATSPRSATGESWQVTAPCVRAWVRRERPPAGCRRADGRAECGRGRGRAAAPADARGREAAPGRPSASCRSTIPT